jgi:hypothetical protein
LVRAWSTCQVHVEWRAEFPKAVSVLTAFPGTCNTGSQAESSDRPSGRQRGEWPSDTARGPQAAIPLFQLCSAYVRWVGFGRHCHSGASSLPTRSSTAIWLFFQSMCGAVVASTHLGVPRTACLMSIAKFFEMSSNLEACC